MLEGDGKSPPGTTHAHWAQQCAWPISGRNFPSFLLFLSSFFCGTGVGALPLEPLASPLCVGIFGIGSLELFARGWLRSS
jgi:hypothetical protein